MDLSSSSSSDGFISSTVSLSSSRTTLSSRTDSLSSFALPETGKLTPEKPLQVLKVLLEVLHENGIPGPNLIRLEKEFNLVTGEGGEGKVFGASQEFQQHLAFVSTKSKRTRLIDSAKFWQSCVIKRLRSDGSRGLAFQVNAAYTEIRLLSKESLRSHPNVIKILGWALCLDSLENSASSIPRLPLLILEKADFDLRSFLISSDYNHTSYMDLCTICLGIGQGLQALHLENLSHGDLKPANILILKQRTWKPDPAAPSCRWLPKLCDFGLATILKEDASHPNLQRYQGTGGWKPPESYLSSPPASLQLCDVFAYGLVTWCVFIGNPSSPISMKMNQDEESATIVEQLGEQRNYQKASRSICAAYGISKSDIYLTLAELTDRAVEFPPRKVTSHLSARRGRKAFLRDPRHIRAKQINRVLILLRDSLNDDPNRRHRRPWDYMNFEKHDIIATVQDPAKYSPDSVSQISQRRTKNLPRLGKQVILRNSHKLHSILQRLKNVIGQTMRLKTRRLRTLTITWIPWLTPTNPWQQAYNEIFFEVEVSLRDKQAQIEDRDRSRNYAFEPNDISPFSHERGDRCHNLDQLYYQLYRTIGDAASKAKIKFDNFRSLSNLEIEKIRRQTHGHASVNDDHSFTLYSFARLHSQVRLCCWKTHCRKDPIYSNHGPVSEVLSLEDEAIMEETSILLMLLTFDFNILAWFCRGEIAAEVLKRLEHEPERLWNWLTADHFGAAEKTTRLTLFLERGCNIGHKFRGSDSSRLVGCQRVQEPSAQHPRDQPIDEPCDLIILILSLSPFHATIASLHSRQAVTNINRSIFQVYLESRSVGDLPMTVCRQFRRIAARQDATPRELFYLTGQSSDWSDDEPMNEKDLMTTALHDAVRAHDYRVVEYLVRTNFNVGAKDVNGQTALALAEELGRGFVNAGREMQHIQNNQIIALLRQTRSPVDRSLRNNSQASRKRLPIGWEAIELDPVVTVYRETSIDSEADSLTFSEPSEGLLENKLALGQRKVTGQGQAYYLNPLRFLHAKLKGSEQATSATVATYGEEWYQQKARDIRTPPSDPLPYRQPWNAIMIRIYHVLRYIAAWTLSPLGYVISNLYVVTLVLLFILISYDGEHSNSI